MNYHVKYGETWSIPKSTFDRLCSGEAGICRYLIQRSGGFYCTKNLKDLRAYMVEVENVTPEMADRTIVGLHRLPINCGGPPDFVRTDEAADASTAALRKRNIAQASKDPGSGLYLFGRGIMYVRLSSINAKGWPLCVHCKEPMFSEVLG